MGESTTTNPNLETEDEEEAINPCPPEWLDNEDNALLRGDAIGDTVYTHRWILKCLFTITEALPKYINHNTNKEDEKNAEQEMDKPMNNDSELNETDNLGSSERETKDEVVSSDVGNNYPKVKLLELDTEVEEAACQLWDMTVEKEVSIHLLNLEEIDVFQLAALIFENSNAPRLTEVTVGVIANLCCEEEACAKLLAKEGNELLLRTLQLAGSTSDVPTLCEVMRLIRLLLWHRINRTQNTTWASCPLLKLLCQESFRNVLSFIIENSLSDPLLASVLELLSNFLFVCLPETGFSVASLYSTDEIINGLINILEKKNRQLYKQTSKERKEIINFAVICLYAFIDTPGAKTIQKLSSKPKSNLEGILQSYFEYEGRVENLEELDSDVCDRLIRVIGLSQLLIPSMKSPSLIITIGRLMALLHGETLQYSVSIAETKKDYGGFTAAENRGEKESGECKIRDHRTFSNPLIEDGGWLSPPVSSESSPFPYSKSDDVPTTLENDKVPVLPSYNCDNLRKDLPEYHKSCTTEINKNNDHSVSKSLVLPSYLSELKEILEDYCYHMLAFWWSNSKEIKKNLKAEAQKTILDVLDQCHAHEVLHILKAVRQKDVSLVPRLQEQIIDSGSHQRLVALLAYMYQ